MLRKWIDKRASLHIHHSSHVNSQRRRSLYLLVFGIVRIVAWMILGVLVSLGLAHVGGFAWAKDLSESVPFVALISIYANWATDLDAATAAFAALVAADGRAATVKAGHRDFSVVENDIALLAQLQPGPEAAALAASIREKLSPGGK